MLLVTKNLAELCTLVIDDMYGELPSRIFAALLNRGRAAVADIAQSTSLTARQVRHGLAVLLQYDLLYFDPGISDEPGTPPTAHYEANIQAAYNLIRAGQVLDMVDNLHGGEARDLVLSMLTFGHTRIADLKEAYRGRLAQQGKEKAAFTATTTATTSAGRSSTNGQVNGNGTHHGDEPYENGTSSISSPQSRDAAATGRRGAEASVASSMDHLNAVLCRLIRAEIVQVVAAASFQSPADRLYKVRQQVEHELFPDGVRGMKKKEEYEAHVSSRLRALRDEPRRLKRTLDEAGHGDGSGTGLYERAKLRKLLGNGDVASGAASHVHEELDPQTIVRMNHEKCAVELRNQRLVQAATNAIGETTAQVYGALLQVLSETIPRCRADQLMDVADSEYMQSRVARTADVYERLGPAVDVFTGIGKVANAGDVDVRTAERLERHARVDMVFSGSGAGGGGGGGDSDGEEDDMDEDDYDTEGESYVPPSQQASQQPSQQATPQPSMPTSSALKINGRGSRAGAGAHVTFEDGAGGPAAGGGGGGGSSDGLQQQEEQRRQQMRQHLLLLCEHKTGFVRHCGRGQWTVDFAAVTAKLREAALDSAIERKAGRPGLRLTRILRERGKLDEKTLPGLALMKKGDVQNKMLELQLHGFVEMQEVPRDNGRTTSRTLFLWFCDPPRALDSLLDAAYKAMVRCLRIRDVHRRAHRDVLEFVQRPDVKGRERETLEQKYYDRYQQYCAIEAQLLGQVQRLDGLVAAIRDD